MYKQQEEQVGVKVFSNLLAHRERLAQLYQSEDFRLLLLPYLEAELSNRIEELLFNKMNEAERALVQGKAQALYAIIHLPEELYQLKSLQEQESTKMQDLYEEQ